MYLAAFAASVVQKALFHIDGTAQDIQIFGSTHDPRLIAGFIGLAVCIAPVVEEAVFRGFLFNALLRWLPAAAAVAVSGLVFGAAHADPVAELATALVAPGGEVVLTAVTGERTVGIRDFLIGPFMTEARDDELLVEVRVPPRPAGEGAAFLEVAPRLGDFAIVAVAALASCEDGRLQGVTVAWAGAGPTPALAPGLGEALEGVPLAGDSVERLAAESAARVTPAVGARGDPEYNRSALAALTSRAVRAAAGDQVDALA